MRGMSCPGLRNSGGENMSLTDNIYNELLDGLDKGLDWQQLLVKYGASKGPLYNAIGRFFTEVGARIAALKEEESRLRSELDQAELMLDSLNQRINEAESNIASLEDRKTTLMEQVETLETNLEKKSELSNHLAELETFGLNLERLSLLQDTLRTIGARYSLKNEEAASKFFNDLKDYNLLLEVEVQLRNLQTQIETKELEAETWEVRAELMRSKHDELDAAIK